MSEATPRPQFLLPFLAPFYARAIPLSWTIIRVASGLDLVHHGAEKLVRLPAIVSALMHGASVAALGPQFGPVQNFLLTFVEFIGGICIVLGLYTQFFAAAAAIDLAIITFTVFWPHGYHAYEYTLLWGIVMFAIALRGGGPYSLDRRLPREL